MADKSAAKKLQEKTEQSPEPKQEQIINITITTDNGFEYHMSKPESVVRDIISPDVPDCLIEVPIPAHMRNSVKYRFLHTNRIATLDVHNEMSFK